ncbi:MAG TPA: winged helix-turn-helix transcriptional regulator [Polyangiales bacterium]|nr:winged helix-turn-helix transcriptional regulator [Polyangiales bacterium]
MKYGQFCPVAKASEVLSERWTLLVLRELLAGATRYRDLHRGLGRISPSVLSARLQALIEHGVIEKTESPAGHGTEYRLTPAGAELAPLIEAVGVWGQRWVRSRMTRDELDVEHLMLNVQRGLVPSAFPDQHAVVGIVFSDLSGPTRRWWLLVDDGRTDVCTQRSGRHEDVTLTCRLRTLAEIVVGDTTLQDAPASGRLQIRGTPKLVRSVQRWFGLSELARVRPARVPSGP